VAQLLQSKQRECAGVFEYFLFDLAFSPIQQPKKFSYN